MRSAAIALFRVGGRAAAALNEDGSINGPSNPAKPGSVLVLYGTGGGATVPPIVAGETTPIGLRSHAILPEINIGSRERPKVRYAGASPGLISGVTQINVRLPDEIPIMPSGMPENAVLLSVTTPETSSSDGYLLVYVAR